mmetsp:Transcript_46886/g.84673  ORF Transcript_46886/g.84673 Transcript_46886/m.84673 type:complete len:114 (+) Transcript_46886:905-1246(+)
MTRILVSLSHLNFLIFQDSLELAWSLFDTIHCAFFEAFSVSLPSSLESNTDCCPEFLKYFNFSIYFVWVLGLMLIQIMCRAFAAQKLWPRAIAGQYLWPSILIQIVCRAIATQ